MYTPAPPNLEQTFQKFDVAHWSQHMDRELWFS